MIVNIDKIKLNKYKQSRRKGNTKTTSLLIAGYSKETAEAQHTKSVIIGDAELVAEMALKDITADYLINDTNKLKSIALSQKKPDLTNYMRANEFISDIAGFRRTNIQQTNIINVPIDSIDGSLTTLTELARRKKFLRDDTTICSVSAENNNHFVAV